MESSREHLLFGELRNPGDLEIAGLTRARHGRWRDFELKLVVSQSRLQKKERPPPPGSGKRILNEREIPGSGKQISDEQEISGSEAKLGQSLDGKVEREAPLRPSSNWKGLVS
jgi:hypothetical protein